MAYAELTINLPTDYQEGDLKRAIQKRLRINRFSYQIEHKSLDARRKQNIHWQIKAGVTSDELPLNSPFLTKNIPHEILEVNYRSRKEKVVIVGSGPAGFFAGYLLQKAGFEVTIIERGEDVTLRTKKVEEFEKNGRFSPTANYSFGEGGAGTFSDGKLTSRSKHISAERNFILDSYIEAGAPEEIRYLTHPHVGSDKLIQIVYNLRHKFIELGGKISFDTLLTDIEHSKSVVSNVITSKGEIESDILIIACGHSSYETYRLLMNRGVQFRTKNFALGFRVEHPQQTINLAQWGKEKLAGVKAAEYRLTYKNDKRPVYTFCMCPGGMVVPATAYADKNIVNGMSLYMRDGEFANAACVAGVHPDELAGKEVLPRDFLEHLSELESAFYELTGGYSAPACTVESFIKEQNSFDLSRSSYPFKLVKTDLWNHVPGFVSNALREGLKDFSKKIRGFEQGTLLGLESKTSAPVQVLREPDGRCSGFENLYMVGEGSGYAGGIISSAADGVKTAMTIVNRS